MGDNPGIIRAGLGAATAGIDAVAQGREEDRQEQAMNAYALEAARRLSRWGSDGQQMAQFILSNPQAGIAFLEDMGGVGKVHDQLKDEYLRSTYGEQLSRLAQGGLTPEEKQQGVISALKLGQDPRYVAALDDAGDLPDWIRNLSPNIYTPDSIGAAIAEWRSSRDESKAASLLRRLPPQRAPRTPTPTKLEKLERYHARMLEKYGPDDPRTVRAQEAAKREARGSTGNGEGGPTAAQKAKNREIDAARASVRRAIREGTDFRAIVGVGGGFSLENPKDPQLIRDWRTAQQPKVGVPDPDYELFRGEVEEWTGQGAAHGTSGTIQPRGEGRNAIGAGQGGSGTPQPGTSTEVEDPKAAALKYLREIGVRPGQ